MFMVKSSKLKIYGEGERFSSRPEKHLTSMSVYLSVYVSIYPSFMLMNNNSSLGV